MRMNFHSGLRLALQVGVMCALSIQVCLAGGSNTLMQPNGLLVDLLSEPLGIESDTPGFSWIVNDLTQNEYQVAYQILVASSLDVLNTDEADVWDSGKVASSESSNVVYGGQKLEPRSVYYWKVRTWNSKQQVSPYSEPQMFTTAIKEEWEGKSIWWGDKQSSSPKTLQESWSDYTLELDFMVVNNAAGICFRAIDDSNNYMWQIGNLHGNPPVAGEPILKTHVCKNGKYAILREVPLEGVIPVEQFTNIFHHLRIEVYGNEIKTYINDKLVDVTVDDTHSHGVIGFRNGGTEESMFDRVHVYNGEETLFEDDFSAVGVNNFTGGKISDGRLVMGRGEKVLCKVSDIVLENNFVFLRKSFNLPAKGIEKAIAHVTALSPEEAKQYVYKLYINGEVVGVGPVRSFSGDNRYNVYDVTDLLRIDSENVVGALNFAKKDKRFLFQMEIFYKDGSRQTVCSDESWKAFEGSQVFPNAGNIGGTYDAPKEYIDARAYPFGWNDIGFDDSAWSFAVEQRAIRNLIASSTRNVGKYVVEPVEVVNKGNNVYFIDFGRAVVGGIQLTVQGTDGHKLEVRLGEELAGAQTVKHNLRTGNHYQDVWTLKSGLQTLEHWGFRVFRYAEIINSPVALDKTNIKAVVLRYPFDDAASDFQCSNSVLNDVWELCKYSIKATSLDLYVDTFTRERLPYEGDAYINQLSHYCVDREFALPRYSIEYLYYRPTWPTEYKQQSVIMAWNDYMYTGNSDSLKRNYSILKSKPLERFINSEGLVQRTSKDDLVDWPASQRDGYVFTDINTVINAFNYQALLDLSNIAKVLGKTKDAEHYATLANTLRDAMNKHLYDASVGAYKDGKTANHHATHASAVPVAFGIEESGNVPAIVGYLAKRGMRVGVYGSQFLLTALYNVNEGQVALDLMSARSGNSWGHMIYDLSATIVTEAWDSSQKPNMSFSHAWASAPANLIPRGMFGIVPLEPGFSVFQIKPQVGDLTWGKLKLPTIKGTIGVEFQNESGEFSMTVTIPTNTTAKIYVPMTETGILKIDGQVVSVPIEHGYSVISSVGSGVHTILCTEN